jgi:alkylated DNA nucleotide flippase Atl1
MISTINVQKERERNMLDFKRCVRCNKETSISECNDAKDAEELLLEEGIAAKDGDVICDDCARELI